MDTISSTESKLTWAQMQQTTATRNQVFQNMNQQSTGNYQESPNFNNYPSIDSDESISKRLRDQ
jgi:hypothetical protein